MRLKPSGGGGNGPGGGNGEAVGRSGAMVARGSALVGDSSTPQAERMAEVLEQAAMGAYDPILDYAGIVIQFGYVIQFSVVWPLAPLVCSLHTMFRLRSNTLRLARCSTRPLPEATTGIGLWQTLLSLSAWICVLVNCLIVSVSTDQLDYITCYTQSFFRPRGDCTKEETPGDEKALIALAVEHVMLLLVFLIHAVVPDRQEVVERRMKKAAFLFKKRYWETHEAEQLMAGNTAPVSLQLRQAPNVQSRLLAVDYESEWRSGSDLSDAYDGAEADERESSDAMPSIESRPRGATRLGACRRGNHVTPCSSTPAATPDRRPSSTCV